MNHQGHPTALWRILQKASKGPKWFQLYFNADAGVTRSLLERAKAAGYSAIIITADALGPGTSDAFLSMSSPFLQERRSVIMTPLRW